MDDKTEVIDLKDLDQMAKKKKKKARKKMPKETKENQSKLGMWKYFIAIGGVAVATLIFFIVLFYNSRGGLVTISMDDYLKANKIQERTLIYIGSDDTISQELDPIMQGFAKNSDKQYQYFDISDITDPQDITKIQNVFVETQNSLVVPMLLVVENGKIVDERTDKSTGVPTGMMVGYLDEPTVIKFLEDNNMY